MISPAEIGDDDKHGDGKPNNTWEDYGKWIPIIISIFTISVENIHPKKQRRQRNLFLWNNWQNKYKKTPLIFFDQPEIKHKK